MFRPSRVPTGFHPHAAPVASSRLTSAVVASLVIGALALCLCVGLTLATSVASFAQPLAY